MRYGTKTAQAVQSSFDVAQNALQTASNVRKVAFSGIALGLGLKIAKAPHEVELL